MKLCFYARIFYLCFGGGGLCYILENTVARAFILTIYSQSKKGLAALSVTRFSRSRNPCTCCPLFKVEIRREKLVLVLERHVVKLLRENVPAFPFLISHDLIPPFY